MKLIRSRVTCTTLLAALALALALAGVPQRGPTPTTRTAGLSHVAVGYVIHVA